MPFAHQARGTVSVVSVAVFLGSLHCAIRRPILFRAGATIAPAGPRRGAMQNDISDILKRLDELKAKAESLGEGRAKLQEHIAKAEEELAAARRDLDESQKVS